MDDTLLILWGMTLEFLGAFITLNIALGRIKLRDWELIMIRQTARQFALDEINDNIEGGVQSNFDALMSDSLQMTQPTEEQIDEQFAVLLPFANERLKKHFMFFATVLITIGFFLMAGGTY